MSIRPPRADSNPAAQQSQRVPGPSGSGVRASEKASATAGDTVTFTSTAAEMLRLEDNLARIPDIDHARVAAIKASIDEGTYRVDPDKIVNGLLQFEKDLNFKT